MYQVSILLEKLKIDQDAIQFHCGVEWSLIGSDYHVVSNSA